MEQVDLPQPGAALSIAPVAPSERLPAPDVLRGVALLGILLANMISFHTPYLANFLLRPPWHDQTDQWTVWFILVFVRGKFFTIFTLLFGAGFALQWARLTQRGERFWALYLRRILVLGLFGVAHLGLLWFGDVLLEYAVVAPALLLFRRCRPRTLVAWACLSYLVPIGYSVPNAARFEHDVQMMPEARAWYEDLRAQVADYRAGDDSAVPDGEQERIAAVAATVAGYRENSCAAVFRQRWEEIRLRLWKPPVRLGRTLACFLLGLAAVQAGLLERPEEHRRLLRWLAGPGLLLGLATSAAYVFYREQPVAFLPGYPNVAAFVLGEGSALLTAFGYLAIVLLALSGRALPRGLAPLAAAGRMALTNYLLQSVICTTLFYGYGLGWYGRTGVTAGTLLAVGIFVVQAGLSVAWLHRLRFGPLEWLWRCITYARLQPLRR